MTLPSPSPHDRITEIVTSWPGVSAMTGSRGEWSFRLGKRELGQVVNGRFGDVQDK